MSSFFGSGSIQEPYLKLVKILRSLEFRASETDPLLEIKSDLQNLIGQQSHRLPNVFSFFDPEFQPSGKYSLMINQHIIITLQIN